MKLPELSNAYLKYMIKKYSSSHSRNFCWQEIRELYPGENEDFISDAFRALAKENFVECAWYDNVPENIELQINAIINAEQNTKLRKIYKCLKELREWI